MSGLVSMLIDVTTSRVLIASTKCGVINLLHSVDGNTYNPCVWDTVPVAGSDRLKTVGALAAAPPETWIEHYYNGQKRKAFFDRDTPPITPRLREIAALYQQKFDALQKIASTLMAARNKLAMPAAYEDHVRHIRHRQALAFRASGYDLEKVSECIFVWQFAEVYDLSPKDAADRIILDSELFEAELWKSEGTKLKYWNRILKATDASALDTVLEDFKREFFVNALT